MSLLGTIFGIQALRHRRLPLLMSLIGTPVINHKKPAHGGLEDAVEASQSFDANSWAINARIFSSLSVVSIPVLILTVKLPESFVIDPA